jgi:hypothetical protein
MLDLNIEDLHTLGAPLMKQPGDEGVYVEPYHNQG